MAFDPIWFAWPICHALSLWYKNKQSSYSFRVHWHGTHFDKKKEVKRLLHYMALKIHMAWCPEFSPVYKTMYGQIWLNILVHNDKKCAFVLSNHQCWEIQQVYTLSTTPGRMTLKGQWCIMLNIQCAFPRLFVHSPCLPRRSSSWAEHRDCDRGDWLHVICGHLLPEEGKDDHKALWWAIQACSTHFQLVVNGLWWTHCITETVFFFFLFGSVFCVQSGLSASCQNLCWASLSS